MSEKALLITAEDTPSASSWRVATGEPGADGTGVRCFIVIVLRLATGALVGNREAIKF